MQPVARRRLSHGDVCVCVCVCVCRVEPSVLLAKNSMCQRMMYLVDALVEACSGAGGVADADDDD